MKHGNKKQISFVKTKRSFFALVFIFIAVVLIRQQATALDEEHMPLMFQGAVESNSFTNAMAYLKKSPELVNQKSSGWDTPLMAATRFASGAMVEMLLTNKADVNGRGSRGETALHVAVGMRDVKKAELLLKHEADVNAKDVDGYTPIVNAYTSSDMIKLLLAYGANINDATTGNTVLSRAVEENAGVGTVQLLLTNGADVSFGDLPLRIWTCRDTNTAALLVSAFKNSTISNAIELVGKMLGAAMDKNQMDMVSTIVAKSVAYQTNQLHKAVSLGDEAKVHSLLSAQPASVNEKEFLGWTPLHMAALSGQDAIAERLLANGAEADLQDGLQCTPLLWATFYGRSNLVETLLRHHANVNIKGPTDISPLDFAIRNDFISIAAMLITNHADLGPCTWWGDTPFQNATAREKIELMKLMLAYGADINAVRGANYKQSALDVAVAGNASEVVRLLIANGANLKTQMRTHSLGGTTLFHLWADGVGNTNIAEQLLASGCDLNAMNGNGQTPLHLALQKWNFTKKRDPDLTNANPESLSEMVIVDSGKDAAVWLLNHKADANAKDKDGQTPLHLIIKRGNLNAIQCLLDHKPDVNATDNHGKTALALFEDFKRQEYNWGHGWLMMVDVKAVEALLVKYGATGEIYDPSRNDYPNGR